MLELGTKWDVLYQENNKFAKKKFLLLGLNM